jgi:CubicO group peptidase (beta-lactamase class C family)
VLALLAGCATVPERPTIEARGDYTPLVDYFSETIPRAMEQHDVTGLSLALVDGGRIVWARGFGHADAAAGIEADEHTVYKIGSITKLFTATAIMQLSERGMVDIEAPVTDYVPELAVKSRFDGAGPIRVRHLMTHHSGLPGDKIEGMFGEPPEDYHDIVDYLATQYVSSPPEHAFAYSNLAVSLEGIVVERASGSSYDDYVTRNILEPLGMTSSSVYLGAKTADTLAKAYSAGEEGVELDLRDVPAGNIYSSVADMSRFMTFAMSDGAVRDTRLVEAATLRRMLTPQNRDVKRDLGRPMGLGWVLYRGGLQHVESVAWHNGGTMHYHSTMVVLPRHDLGVVLLSNSDTGGRITEPMADAILTTALEIKHGIAPPEPDVPCAGGAVPAGQAELIAGRYATPLGIVNVARHASRLTVSLPGAPTLDLVPCGDEWLAPEFRLFGFIPIPVADLGGLRLKGVEIDGTRYLAAKDGPYGQLIGRELRVVPIPETWRQAQGSYRVVNGDPRWGFQRVDAEIVDGVAVARVEVYNGQQLELVLEPIDEDEAVVQGVGRNTGDTLFLHRDGDRTVIEATGYVFERE